MVKRTLTNAGDPFVDAQGHPFVGAKIEFWLVEDGIPMGATDSLTSEFIPSYKITAVTNASGVFTVDLWPNVRATTPVMYACMPRVAGEVYFEANVTEGPGSLSYIQFKLNDSDYTPVDQNMVTRVLTNTGQPFLDPVGQPYAGAKIDFQLVKNGVPTSAIDALTLQSISSDKIIATTDANGLFSISLWPNTRATEPVMYSCLPHIAGQAYFEANLPEGLLAMTYQEFKNNGQAPAQQEAGPFEEHVADTDIHFGDVLNDNKDYVRSNKAWKQADKGIRSHANIDTDLNRLAETSGRNTGDQDLSLLATHYKHIQSIPQSIWTIIHNLGRKPSVSITDTSLDDEQVFADIKYIDHNTVQIEFGGAMGGEAYLI